MSQPAVILRVSASFADRRATEFLFDFMRDDSAVLTYKPGASRAANEDPTWVYAPDSPTVTQRRVDRIEMAAERRGLTTTLRESSSGRFSVEVSAQKPRNNPGSGDTSDAHLGKAQENIMEALDEVQHIIDDMFGDQQLSHDEIGQSCNQVQALLDRALQHIGDTSMYTRPLERGSSAQEEQQRGRAWKLSSRRSRPR